MNAKEIFSIVVRALGLVSIGRSLTDLAFVTVYLIGSDNISVNSKFPGADFLIGVFYISAGLYLLRGAPLLVNFAFPKKSVPEKERDTEEDSN